MKYLAAYCLAALSGKKIIGIKHKIILLHNLLFKPKMILLRF